MFDVSYSCYELEPLSGRAMRLGALLRIGFSNGTTGYADCHPWPELGDLPLAEQLNVLRECSFETPLLQRSLHFARLDATARAEGRHLLDGLTIPPSHFLVSSTDDLKKILVESFTHAKIKVQKDSIEEALNWIRLLSDANVMIRLDFNHCLDESAFRRFLEKARPYLSSIDFCEDPFVYDNDRWRGIQQEYGIALARDRLQAGETRSGCIAAVSIWKPAVEGDLSNSSRLVITSYLDHPIGQVSAAYEAGRLLRAGAVVEPCGLLSHRVYRPTPFSEQLCSAGSAFVCGEGTGIGFDRLLSQTKWRPCR